MELFKCLLQGNLIGVSCIISGKSILSLVTTQFKFSKKCKLVCIKNTENFVSL